MNVDVLKPSLELLTKEYLLVQAWKKTASFIRRHNWYSDTLELDRSAANLPRFIAELSEKLIAAEEWGSPPWEIAGGSRLAWFWRWAFWRSQVNMKRKSDLEG